MHCGGQNQVTYVAAGKLPAFEKANRFHFKELSCTRRFVRYQPYLNIMVVRLHFRLSLRMPISSAARKLRRPLLNKVAHALGEVFCAAAQYSLLIRNLRRETDRLVPYLPQLLLDDAN